MPYLDRTFGIEIEHYLPVNTTRAQVAAAIAARSTACTSQTYNHLTTTTWKVITDGSLNDYTRGAEVVSPILRGEAGLSACESVIGTLTDFGCTVSRACGLHVHVGVGNNPGMAFWQNILKLYAYYEPVIDRFMPPSRRDSLNSFCRSVTSVSLAAIDRAGSLHELMRLLPGSVPRNHKLNLAAYNRHKTVEFRQHSGTLDANKARQWTTFCMRMVEAAHRGRGLPTSTVAGNQMNRARRGTNTHLIGQLLLRPEGVTYAEARQATGWRQLSMPPIAQACGLSFTTQRMGRELRFYAQAAAASTSIAPTLENLLEVLECTPEERGYFRSRTANLSSSVDWVA